MYIVASKEPLELQSTTTIEGQPFCVERESTHEEWRVLYGQARGDWTKFHFYQLEPSPLLFVFGKGYIRTMK